jgi:glycosyltransferase involved in cell wall biosynthesis
MPALNEEKSITKTGITVILPAHNEEVALGSMVLRAKKYADRVIVIDDGSSDATGEVAILAGAQVIRHPQNIGKGAALRTGFKVATQNSPRVIITMDSDGQHNPTDIPKLAAPILADEADMVNGSRYLNDKEKNTPRYRRAGQKVLDAFSNLNSNLAITDTQSGFRAFAPHTVPVFGFRSTGLAIESEMLVDAAKAGLRIKEVGIGVRYDVDGSSEHPVSHGVKVLVRVLHDMELNRPLYYFTLPGIILGFAGLLMGLNLMSVFYHGGTLSYGLTLLMIILTLTGVFMAFTGIILHTMSRLITENIYQIGLKRT